MSGSSRRPGKPRGSSRRPRAPRKASRRAARPPLPPLPTSGAQAPASPARVLALGADRASGDLAELLAATGCEVVAVKDASMLASLIQQGGFDAVVLDLKTSRAPAHDLNVLESAAAATDGEGSEVERLTQAVLHARKTAHDLAQPLTTILARAQMLLAKLGPQDPHRNAVSVICQESDRLARIITGFQQLKELARPPGRQER